MATDYYRVLGVMPGADDVVIRAAYKALAQRYHPDRFSGDPAEAHRRMAEINAAFAILGDPVKRSAYDAERRDERTTEFASSETEWQQDQAFSAALDEMDRRWGVACGIFPDLERLKRQLHQLSSKLSFAFVMTMLESKDFHRRNEIAGHLEHEFLERYFGGNPIIQDFAKELVVTRKKEAAKVLNDLVSVMGSDVDPMLLISRVEHDFGITEYKARIAEKEERIRLCRTLKGNRSMDAANRLVAMEGLVVDAAWDGPFLPNRYFLRKKDGTCVAEVAGDAAYLEWVRSTLCK